MREIFILAGKRTAIGSFGGALAQKTPVDLAHAVMADALGDAGISPEAVELVVAGQVLHTAPQDMYLARVAAMAAGVPETVPAMMVNRLCGSGVQAIVSAMQALQLGEGDVALAGGAESMSRAPFILPAARFGQKMGDVGGVDMMLGALTCPFGTGHMGVTAENVAQLYGISRAAQDAFAFESQRRAALAQAEGRFASQITAIEVGARQGSSTFVQDQHPKPTSLARLAELRPAFRPDGTVTAGNASGLNDGAAALVLAAGRGAAHRPRARIMGYAVAGVEPKVMGLGPIPAVEKLCRQLGIRAVDFDIVESNEAFAAQAIAVSRELGLDPERVNPNGGAVALGHPIGATGAMLVVKALYELERSQQRTALITMCIGGGQGIALAIERV